MIQKVIKPINYAQINIFHKKGYWFKILMDFWWPILAKIDLICQQPAVSHWGGVQEGTTASSGVLERMAEGSHGVLAIWTPILRIFGQVIMLLPSWTYDPLQPGAPRGSQRGSAFKTKENNRFHCFQSGPFKGPVWLGTASRNVTDTISIWL